MNKSTEMINVEPLDVREAELASRDAIAILNRAKMIKVTCKADQDIALTEVSKIKKFSQRLEAGRKKITAPLDAAKKAVMDLFRGPAEDLEEAERLYKRELLSFEQEQRRRAEEAQRKIEEDARKEEERKRKIKEDQEKAWREKEEAASKDAERLLAEGKAEEAQKAMDLANKAAKKAEERAEEADQVYVPRPIVEEVEKAEGQSVVCTWKAEVTDLFALCNAIARGELPETVVAPVMKELNALARTWKNKKTFEGVRFYAEENLAIRR